ncbi:MAG: FAD-dependent oxidoreductase [Verrucomicrobia bacterium]|nr:FAD-dependent oxidoreductase [Verrucomicrobiota bacterium]
MTRCHFLVLPALLLLATPVSLFAAAPRGPASADVVVYGGVPCGIASAIAAAREGATVILIEPTRHIGGLSTSGINTAETEHMLKWTIGGLALEFYERLGKHYGTGKPEFYFESSVAEKVYKEMLAEAEVDVRYGLRVERVEKDGARIRRIVLSDGSALVAKVFVDAGYEGDLMARAGVGYTWGREGRDEFGEEAAGIRLDKTPRKAATVDGNGNLLPGVSAWAKDLKEGDGDRKVMNYNFRLTFAKADDKKVPIPAPERYDRARYRLLENWLREKTARGEKVKLTDLLDLYGRRNGKFEVNNKQSAIISLGHFGGQFDYPDADYATRERTIADHRDYTLGLLHFLANDESVPANVRAEMRAWGLHKDEFTDNGHWPYQLYVREARRMRGATVVTQHDVTEARRKPDAIGISSHFIDCHHVQRVALSPTEFANEGRIWRISYAYQIPYRALTPKPAECANLLVPGAASFTHVAFCTYRLESVWMIAGHAAGVAAAVAAKENKPVQRLDVPALQDRLRSQKQVVDFQPGQPERFERGEGGFKEF